MILIKPRHAIVSAAMWEKQFLHPRMKHLKMVCRDDKLRQASTLGLEYPHNALKPSGMVVGWSIADTRDLSEDFDWFKFESSISKNDHENK